jgi:hypothetical protein
MDAALKLDAVRGYDLVMLSELLLAAESCLVEALPGDRRRWYSLVKAHRTADGLEALEFHARYSVGAPAQVDADAGGKS